MGDLAKYVAEVVEFVVAGVLVLVSLLLLAYALVHPDLAALPRELPFLASIGALLPVFGLAIIYSLGILAEGMSRIAFEHGLGRLTAERIATHLEHVGPQRQGEAYYVQKREEWRAGVMARSVPLATMIDGQLKRLRIERATALSGWIASVALVVEVVRRGADEAWEARAGALALVVLVTYCAHRLSRERLGRYVDTIVRCHATLDRTPPA